jgi:spore germination cell wall hydrolase CwlJ-like protein
MTDGVGTAHKRADYALVGAVSVLLLGVAPLVGFNLYQDRSTEPPMPTAKPVQAQVVVGSPVELAGAQLASEGGCLAEAMYYEARGEGLAGQKAVAEVVLRRTHNRNYARTLCGVVYEGVQEGRKTGCQFSFACDGSLDRKLEGEAWDQARLLAEKIMSGAVVLGDMTGHAIAYHSIGVSPPWKDNMLRTVQIGNHIFYRFMPRDQVASTAAVPSQDIEPKIKTLRAVGEGA